MTNVFQNPLSSQVAKSSRSQASSLRTQTQKHRAMVRTAETHKRKTNVPMIAHHERQSGGKREKVKDVPVRAST